MARTFHRLAAIALLAGSAYACRDVSGPTLPLDTPDANLVVLDASTGGNPGVLFLPPLRPNSSKPGTFDPSVPLRVEVRLVGSPTAQSYSVADGSIEIKSNAYELDWKAPSTIEAGQVYRVSAYALTLLLGQVDIQVAGSGRDMVQIRQSGESAAIQDVPRTMPIRLWLNTEAVTEAEGDAEQECATGGGVIDCDVEVVTNSGGGTVTVYEEDEEGAPVAGQFTVDPDDVVDGNGDPVEEYVLTLLHLPLTNKPSPVIPAGQQFPFNLRATITDGAGNPLFFATGASLVVCQPEDMETNDGASYYLPAAQAVEQQIIKVDPGGTVALPTVYGAPECEGYSPPVQVGLGSLLTPSGVLGLAKRGLNRLAAYVVAEPLRAGHGGLTTTKSILDLSDFAGALLTDPAASTASVPDGTVGLATVMTIQANVTGTVAQVRGGDAVTAMVSGANAAVLTVGSGVVDNGDGTYTATYTPTTAGVDQVAITIEDPLSGTPVAISGSPFTSNVAAPPSAGGPFLWDPIEDGNGHWYDYVPFTDGVLDWIQARAAAESSFHRGMQGHLVTITSGGEQGFVTYVRTALNLPDWRAWIGLYDPNEGAAFSWVTGEALSYTNWAANEPNNIGSELYVEMFGSGVWNNNLLDGDPSFPVTGYVVEYEPGPANAGINGAVLDQTGAPIPGAQVTVDPCSTWTVGTPGSCDPLGTPLAAITNVAGQFSFPNLTSGGYRVGVSVIGFQNGSQVVQLDTGSSVGSVTLTLQPNP